MVGIYKVTFFGHRVISDILAVEDALYEQIKKLVLEKNFIEFCIGRNGDFDRCVSSVIRRVKKEVRDDNCVHILYLPYPTLEYKENVEEFERYFDEVFIFENKDAVHPKAIIGARNRQMVDYADLIISYIERPSGGAYTTVKYAESKGKKIINICDILNKK